MLKLEEMQKLAETISLQEVVSKCKDTYKDLSKTVQDSLDKGVFDYDEQNIFGKGWIQEQYGYTAMGKEDAAKIHAKIVTTPLRTLLKEFLGKSSTTGIGGAAYLIPTKIYQVLAEYAAIPDILPDISMAVIPPEEIPGATHTVTISKGGSYKPKKGSSGAKKPEEEIGYVQATLDFTTPFYIHFNIGNDLIEDSQFNLIEQHIRMAGNLMGQYSTELAIAVMKLTTDGDGTVNDETAGADTTTMTDLRNAVDQVLCDEFVPDRYLAPSHVMADAIMKDVTYFAAPGGAVGADGTFREKIFINVDPHPWGMTWIRCESSSLWTEESNLPATCVSQVFTKDYSYISGRKRWLRIENYSDPVRDLVGAVVSGRQDTVSVYNDSVCHVEES